MRYRAFVITPAGNVYFPLNNVGNSNTQGFTTVEEAQKGIESLLSNASYKTYFTQGYDAYIIDNDSHKVVAYAGIPVPKLSWSTIS